ncbi:MAG: hypothetical protein MJK18_01850, partial [Bdellovibrionales bacterium]|nr:hypothetical protein [Bdellovibrionales bacterium]
MRVLLILIEPPLAFGNAASRWFHVLYNELQKRGHSVDVLVVSGVEKDIKKAQEVFKDDKHNIQLFPFGKSHSLIEKLNNYLQPHRIKFSPEFMKALHDMNPDQYDVVHIEQTWAGWTSFPWAHKALIN